MAGYFGPSLGRVSVGGGGVESGTGDNFILPNGACGYRDLSAGAQAPTCACRRFWLNTGQHVNHGGQSWCFCGHHACFHDHVSRPLTSPPNTAPVVEDRHNIFPIPQQNVPYTQPVGFPAPTWSELIADCAGADLGNEGVTAAGLSYTGLGMRNTGQQQLHTRPQSQPQSINGRLWQALNGFARNQTNGGSLGDASNLPSTAVPSLCEQPRAATPTQQLDGYMRASYQNMRPPVAVPPTGAAGNHRTDDYSATEVATPSIRGTPDLRPLATLPIENISPRPLELASVPVVRSQLLNPSPSQARPADPLPRTIQATSSLGPALSIQEMCNTIQDFGQRINALESLSFSYMPSETILDRFDLLDGRVLDIEQWRTEQDREQLVNDTDERLKQTFDRLDDLEQWRGEQDRIGESQHSEMHRFSSGRYQPGLPLDTSSVASDGSFDENAAAQTETVVLATLAASAESRPRIDALEARIVELEAVLPSATRPWSIKIVLLPFSRQLPGIWFSASESSQHHSLYSQAPEEWERQQTTMKSSFRSTASSGWTTESIEAWNRSVDQQEEWLSAKACGPSGTVFQRLASRGLVQDIMIQAPDSRHIWTAISEAFSHVPQGAKSSSPDFEGCQGLREHFIPLRKVRKSTRLRFLSPAEMVTSTSWDALFLDSVCMKVNEGERRLYLTTADGYLQPRESVHTWRSFRGLPAYGIDGEVQAAQVVGNAIEACWAYHDGLDHRALSLQSSFQSEGSAWGISSEDDEHGAAVDHEIAMISPSTTRHLLGRSLSFPSSVSLNGLDVEPGPKRRATSFEVERHTTSTKDSGEYLTKRRRVSNSPELERRGVNFTPRWSREPPSPYTGDDAGLGRSSQATGSRHRGTTPFAYATPHSHHDSRIEGDDVTEIDEQDVASGDSPTAEESEEWHGVKDGQNGPEAEVNYNARNGHKVASEDGHDGNLSTDLLFYGA